METVIQLQPRIIRVNKAPVYCGMCKYVFNQEIRPYLREVRIGTQGKGFDRLEMDRVLDDYIERCSRAPEIA